VEANATEEGISFIEGIRLLAGAPADLDVDGSPGSGEREWSFVDAGKWLSDVLSGLRNPDGLNVGGRSKGFRGTLRHYQEIGHNWLWFLSNLGLGACLADDMGLGKTVQVLSLLLALKENKSSGKASLLVLPASLLANWKAEMKRFAPALQASFLHPSETDKIALAAVAGNRSEVFAKADVVLTTYGMLLRQKWLLDVQWRLVILDEAQAIKNPSTRQTRTVKQLKADARIALTGTPVRSGHRDPFRKPVPSPARPLPGYVRSSL
jgi:non-specific serine/threonine protein kinase